MINKTVCILALMLLFTSSAMAEIRTLPTDTLKSGQIEGEIFYEHIDSRMDTSLGEFKQKSNITSFGVGVGVTNKFKLYGELPYYVTNKGTLGGNSVSTDGFGDAAVGARYRILDNDCDAVGLSVGIESLLDSGAKGVSSRTYVVAPYVAVSKTFKRVVPYVQVAAGYSTRDESASLFGSGGFQYRLPRVVFDARATGLFNGGGKNSTTSFNVWGASLRSHIRIVEHLYAVPFIGMSLSSASQDKQNPSITYDGATAYNGGFGLYWLY